nr:hypothetical protein [Methanobrevibacter sp.]
MTGMRGFSFNFVKSFPISSKEFEIETETVIIFFVGVILHVLKNHNSNRLEHHLILLNEYKND